MDFFDRLTSRTLGTAPTVEPLIPPMFAAESAIAFGNVIIPPFPDEPLKGRSNINPLFEKDKRLPEARHETNELHVVTEDRQAIFRTPVRHEDDYFRGEAPARVSNHSVEKITERAPMWRNPALDVPNIGDALPSEIKDTAIRGQADPPVQRAPALAQAGQVKQPPAEPVNRRDVAPTVLGTESPAAPTPAGQVREPPVISVVRQDLAATVHGTEPQAAPTSAGSFREPPSTPVNRQSLNPAVSGSSLPRPTIESEKPPITTWQGEVERRSVSSRSVLRPFSGQKKLPAGGDLSFDGETPSFVPMATRPRRHDPPFESQVESQAPDTALSSGNERPDIAASKLSESTMPGEATAGDEPALRPERPEARPLTVNTRIRFEPATSPGLASTGTERNQAMAAESLPPTIQVTIGRIEVRATPAPAQVMQRKTASAGLSLDDYLKARNGGRR